ncbi:MAG: regulatory protein RecX [Rikenellaceae bacterium]
MRPKRVDNAPRPKSAEQALTSLMALCARAERSSGDARRLMSRWGVAKEEQEGVLARLIKERFIDDQRYATAFVREKTNLNGWGRYKIRAELQRKGVAATIIDEELSHIDRDEMSERLDTLLAKRARSVKYNSKYHLRDKLIRYGASLGYDFATVSEAVQKRIAAISFDEAMDESEHFEGSDFEI